MLSERQNVITSEYGGRRRPARAALRASSTCVCVCVCVQSGVYAHANICSTCVCLQSGVYAHANICSTCVCVCVCVRVEHLSDILLSRSCSDPSANTLCVCVC